MSGIKDALRHEYARKIQLLTSHFADLEFYFVRETAVADALQAQCRKNPSQENWRALIVPGILSLLQSNENTIQVQAEQRPYDAVMRICEWN